MRPPATFPTVCTWMVPQVHAPAPQLLSSTAKRLRERSTVPTLRFVLANVPNPPASVALFRNGLLLNQGGDYTLSANAITFVTGAVPQPGDILSASYRLSVSVPGVGFVDQETPSGAINGANAVFTLSQTPSPGTSLAVYRNGLRMTLGADYTLSGAVITFVTGLVPQSSDTLSCSYRVVP